MILQDKICLITGSGRGIGRALAIEFSKLGASVILTARTESELNETKKLIEKNDIAERKSLTATADIRNYDEIKKVVDMGINKFGRIDTLVNNAGFSKIKPITRLRVNEFQDMIDVNVKGVFNATHAVVPFMIEQKSGSILNTGTVAINIPLQGWSSYAMTKSALTSFTTCLAVELKQFKINVNTIMPNMVHTPMLHSGRSPEQIAALDAKQPEELVPYYSFLASNEGKKITGLNISLDLMDKIMEIITPVINSSVSNSTQISENQINNFKFNDVKELLEERLKPEEFRIAKKLKKLIRYLVSLQKQVLNE